MTLEEINKIDKEAYENMQKERTLERAKLDEYFKGYEAGIDKTIRLLRNSIIAAESQQNTSE